MDALFCFVLLCLGPLFVQSQSLHPIRLILGLSFEKLDHTAVYTHSISLRYLQHFNLKLLDSILADISSDYVECTFPPCNISKLVHSELLLLANESITNSKYSLFELLSLHETPVRTKRSSSSDNFLTDIFSWCCNLASKSETLKVFHSQNKLNQNFELLRDSLITEHRFLTTVSSLLPNITSRIQEKFNKLTNVMENEFNSYEHRILQLLTIQHFTTHHEAILQHCRSKLLPLQVITPDILKSDLHKLNKRLEMTNLQLAVPLSRLSDTIVLKFWIAPDHKTLLNLKLISL